MNGLLKTHLYFTDIAFIRIIVGWGKNVMAALWFRMTRNVNAVSNSIRPSHTIGFQCACHMFATQVIIPLFCDFVLSLSEEEKNTITLHKHLVIQWLLSISVQDPLLRMTTYLGPIPRRDVIKLEVTLLCCLP